jgi:hypothetical protein
MFTMLSGEFVHEGDNAEHIRVIAATEPARSLATVAPDIPAQVVRIVDKALAFDKASRFESAAIMRDAVAKVLGDFYGELSTDILASFVKKVRESRDTTGIDESAASPPKRTELETLVGRGRSAANGDRSETRGKERPLDSRERASISDASGKRKETRNPAGSVGYQRGEPGALQSRRAVPGWRMCRHRAHGSPAGFAK